MGCVRGAAVLALTLWLAAEPAPAQEGRRGSPAEEADRGPVTLPAGPGRPIVIETCVQCHDLRAVAFQRKPLPAWRRTVNEMVWRGAALLPGEADTVARYLASSFGPNGPSRPAAPQARRLDEGAALLPPGPGRALVLKACVQCHDLKTTTDQRKTTQEWRRSVDLMVRMGAPLVGSEMGAVADYLSAAFGSPQEARP